MHNPRHAASYYDLLGFSATGQLQLVVEIKSRAHEKNVGMAGDWLRRVGQQEPTLYALFIAPEFMLLRLPASQRPAKPLFVEMGQPGLGPLMRMHLLGQFDYLVNTTACLDAAIDTQRMPLNKLTGGGLERVVNSWLSFALLLPAAELTQQPTQEWLVGSGLHEALRNGKVANTSAESAAYGFAA